MTNWDAMTLNCCEEDMYNLKSENDGDNVADRGKFRRSTSHRFNMTVCKRNTFVRSSASRGIPHCPGQTNLARETGNVDLQGVVRELDLSLLQWP